MPNRFAAFVPELGKFTLAIALVALVWSVVALDPTSWPDSSSATNVARGTVSIAPGETKTFVINSIDALMDGLEIRTTGETSGVLDMSLLTEDDGSAVSTGSAEFHGDVTAFLPVSAVPRNAKLQLQLDRPADSKDPLNISVQHEGSTDQISYLWYNRRTYPDILAGEFQGAARSFSILASIIFWLIVPGIAIWRLLRLPKPATSFEGLSLVPVIAGISVGAALLVGAFLSYPPISLRFMAGFGRWPFPLFVLLLIGAWLYFRWHRRSGNSTTKTAQPTGKPFTQRLENSSSSGWLALGLVLIAVVVTRSGATLDLAGPSGVDGTAVVNFARRIGDRGSFLDLSSAAVANREDLYHLGLSGLTALIAWTSGATLDQSLMVLGQTLQCIALLGLASITVLWGGGPWSAAAAVLVAGFVLPLPGFALAWSRFTEIAGLALIPGILFLIQRTFSSEQLVARRFAVALGIATSGLLLTHYRVFAFAVVFAPAAMALGWSGRGKFLKRIRLGAITAVCVALALLPWLIPVAAQFWLPTAGATVDPAEFPSWTLTSAGAGWVLAAMALITGPLASFSNRRQLVGLFVAGWMAAGLAAVTLPAVFGWRLGVAINPLSAAIAIYLPTGVWAAWLMETLRQRNPKFQIVAPALTVVTLAALVARSSGPSSFGARLADQVLLSNADREAIDWIRDYIPEDSRFIVNATPWAYGLYIGADGGYWIEALTGRKTLVPPLSYAYRPAADQLDTNNQIAALLAEPASTLVQRWRDAGYRYVYLGRKGGNLDPATLRQDIQASAVYDHDGVLILDLGVRPSGS